MSGEPELQPYTSSEWVTYAKQLMRYHGLWDGDESPEYDDALVAAVRTMQETYGLSPMDGVLRAGTWAVLTGEATASTSEPQSTDQHTMSANPDAQPEQVPASFESQGMPAFQFTLPEIPIAEADFDTGSAEVHIELSLTGAVQVAFPEHLEGATEGNEGLELEAKQAVDHLNQSIRIGGIGGRELTLSDSVGSEYAQTGFGMDSSGAMVFTGQVQVSYMAPTGHGNAQVQGTLGYSLKVRVTPHPQSGEPESEPVMDSESWFERHAPQITAETVLLVAVVAVAAILTDGAALPLLAL